MPDFPTWDEFTGFIGNLATTIDTSNDPSQDRNGLAQGEYNFTSHVFPEDLSADYHGHYIVININVPTYKGQSRSAYSSASQQGASGLNIDVSTKVLTNEYSKVDNLKFNAGAEPVSSGPGAGPVSSSRGNLREFGSIKRSTRRIAASIALFMPAQAKYTHENKYDEVSLTAFGAKAAAIGVGFGGSMIAGSARGAETIGNLIGMIGGAAKTIGQASSLLGFPINPRMEVLYTGTPQRQFIFEFLMAPKNQTESLAIKRIVDTLRFHAAPEVETLLGFIPTFIPPSEFDITFFTRGKENTNIPRINTCVLESIAVDYAPTGGIYSTFTNGYPVATVLSMAFRETEILHKRRVLQGF